MAKLTDKQMTGTTIICQCGEYLWTVNGEWSHEDGRDIHHNQAK